MSTIYDGFFENGKSYSLSQIQGKFRCVDPRPIKEWLRWLGVFGVRGPKGESLYLGDDINLAIAEKSKCPENEDKKGRDDK